jgi:SPP1 gp7 family putative phage head morphogenesis protein
MSKAPNLGFALTLAPHDAIEYFESLGYRVSRNALDSYNAARHRAFTVAGVAEMDFLGDIKKELEKSLQNGTTLTEFQKNIQSHISRRGWQQTDGGVVADGDGVVTANNLAPYRLETIFRTNLQSAYMAGKYKQLQRDIEIAPYWQYVAVMDERTRPSHAALHGLVFRHDDPFWDSHYPPCDFNCRCSVRSLRSADLDRFGLKPLNSDGLLSEGKARVGGAFRPVTIFKHPNRDVSFSARPGFGQRPRIKDNESSIGQVLTDKIQKSDPMIAAKTYDKNLQFKRTTAEEFKSWVDQINAGKQARGEYRLVGVLSYELIKQLESLNNPSLIPHNSAILLRDKQLLHLFRDSKKRRDATLSYNSIQQLPKLINEPLAIYYDELDPALVYVISSVEVSSEKVIVRINYSETIREDNIRQDVRSNFIRSAGRVDNTDLKDKRYRLLWEKK